jgi:iron complex transport system substrate-binding protein
MQLSALALGLALSFTLTASAGVVGTDGPVSVADDRGRQVALAKPATRVISLAPNTTELVYAIGAEATLVAVTDVSDYPTAARLLPSVGGINGLDLERIIALHPDLVIAWASGNSRTELDALEQAGVVVFESEPSSVLAVAFDITRLGELTGRRSESKAASRALLFAFDAIARRESSKVPVTVFYQVWDPPLITLGGPQLITNVISACGGRNIFADLSALAPTVDPEAVIARHPDVIVTEPSQQKRVEESWHERAKGDPKWHARVTGIDPDLLIRGGPRIVEGTRELCAALDASREAVTSK